VKEEWWTGPVELVTDETGSITVSGFTGEYEVELEDGRTNNITIGKDARPCRIVL
jgi:hypothetical protein